MTVFSVAVNAAIRMGILLLNPVKGVKPPRTVRREIAPLSPEQCGILFEHCQGHRLGDMVILTAMTGCRKGELFALR